MATTETDIQREIQIAASQAGCRLFRNNVGKFRALHSERVVACGLCPGSADLIGWRTVTITPDMVGKRIAQFMSVEVKTPKGKVQKAQENWRQTVSLSGGLGFIARSITDFMKGIS